MYKYEMHLHTSPVSGCAKATPEETVEFYKSMGYDGIFITNHFIDRKCTSGTVEEYLDKLEFFCSDYEKALEIGNKIGLKVFFGLEMDYKGSDFLVYGLDKQWYTEHTEILSMKMSEKLSYLMEAGALVIHAHPFREANYIDHIRLYPRCVQGVEIINACRTPFENQMAELYAKSYGLMMSAGSDNHRASEQKAFAGLMTDTPIDNEKDFVDRFINGETKIFYNTIE